jgi:hypothetical protein
LRPPSLKHRIGISCRSTELESFGDCCFLTARRVGHGAGRSGTHEHRIWRGRYRRACDRGFHGRLCLCLPRGSSGQRGREAPKTPAGGEGTTAQAARPDGGLVRLSSRKDGSSNSIGIAKLSRCAKRAAWPHHPVYARGRQDDDNSPTRPARAPRRRPGDLRGRLSV